MLSKKFRLNRKQIGLIHKRGRRFSLPAGEAGLGKIGAKCLPNHLEFSRFAVNVPVKVYKKAVDRNRLRRLIYDKAGQLNLKGYDCLIGVFRPLTDEKNEIQQLKKLINL